MFNYTEVIALLVQEGPHKDSTGRKHCAQEFEAVSYINQGKYLYEFCARPFEELEEEEEEEVEKSGFSNFTYMYVAVAVYLATFESVIVYRNTRGPCYVSKRAYSCRVPEF